MKKISLASSILAVGLLAACSNDAPTFQTNAPENDGPMKYIAVGVTVSANSETRAATGGESPDGTVPGEPIENYIKSATLYITDENDVVLCTATNTSVVHAHSTTETKNYVTTPVIPFGIGETIFKSLTEYKGNVNLYLIANAADNAPKFNAGSPFVANKVVEVGQWKWDAGDKDVADAKDFKGSLFLMSNNNKVTGKLVAYNSSDENNDGSDEDSAWTINTTSTTGTNVGKIELTRLNARFDFACKSDYAASHEAKFKPELTGVKLMNKNDQTYYFWHHSDNGTSTGAHFGPFYNGEENGGVSHVVTPHGTWYGAIQSSLGSLTYTSTAPYKSAYGDTPSKLDYAFSNAIEGTDVSNLSYKNVTYMAFEVTFTYTGYTEGTTPFYVYNGQIVGTLDEINTEGYAGGETKDDVNTAVRMIINDLKAKKGVDDKTGKQNPLVEGDLTEALGFYKYTPVDGKCKTYYCKAIHNKRTDNDCCKYRVLRNRLYNVSVSGISAIGHTGSYKPDAIVDEVGSHIDVNVAIMDWDKFNLDWTLE